MNRSNRRMSWRRWMCLGSVPALALAVVLWSQARAQDPVPNPQPVTVQFSSSSYTASEADGTISLTVNLNQSTNQTVTVAYDVPYQDSGGTAHVTGTIQFSPGETSKTFQTPYAGDSCCLEDLVFTIYLSDPLNATLGPISSATVTVLDDDVCP